MNLLGGSSDRWRASRLGELAVGSSWASPVTAHQIFVNPARHIMGQDFIGSCVCFCESVCPFCC